MTEKGKNAFIGALIGGIPLTLVATATAYSNNPTRGTFEGIIFYGLLVGSAYILAKKFDREQD